MYSFGLYPLIRRPSRITSATLTDNIFTNELKDNIDSGLLIDDTSDHRPIFAMYTCDLVDTCNVTNNPIKYARDVTECNMNALRCELLQHTWHNVITMMSTHRTITSRLISCEC